MAEVIVLPFGDSLAPLLVPSLLARYDMVLHLVTAADGAEKHYTTANNTARRETAAEAVALDRKIAKNW